MLQMAKAKNERIVSEPFYDAIKVSHLPGSGCSKLTTSLVNVSLNFQKLISQICQCFLLKKCEKLLHSHFFNKKFQCIWL